MKILKKKELKFVNLSNLKKYNPCSFSAKPDLITLKLCETVFNTRAKARNDIALNM